MKAFSAFLTEGGVVDFEGTVGELKKKLRKGESIKWNARGPQPDSTKIYVILKDYEDVDYYAITKADDSGDDYGHIEPVKKRARDYDAD